MKNKKLALMLSGILSITTLLSGCGAKSPANDNDNNNKITIMAPLVSANAPDKNSQLEKKLEELTGYEVDMTWVPNSSYADKVSITMASDNVPNLLVVQGKDATTISNTQKGAFWKLDDYIKNYDNLSQADPNIKLNSSFNGETYGIYRKRDVIRSCVAFRKDWLDKLGLQVPKTLDEFNKVLEAFKNNDPDGNGVNDTTGMVIPKWPGTLNTNSPFDQMAIWFGAPNGSKIENGKMIPDFMTDEYMNSLDYFKWLYQEGLINKDFAVLDSDKWGDVFVNGKAGVLIDTQSTAAKLKKQMLEKYGDDGQNGDSYVTIVGNIQGAVDKILPTTGYSGMFMIPKQSVKNEKQLNKVLDFLNKINTEETNILLNNGEKGTYYEIEDGKYKPTTDQTLLNDVAAYSQLSTNVRNYDILKIYDESKFAKDRKEIMDTGEKKAVFDPCASLISEVYSKKGVQLQNIMSDARIQYIAGQIDKDGYKAAQQQWLSTGGQEYIDEMTKLYNENLK